MDNVTHALAGALMGAAATALVERRAGRPSTQGFGRVAMLLGVVAAELPDADLLYAGPVLGMGRLGYLLHHRGHTHTVVFALAAALLLWGAALARRRRAGLGPGERGALLALAAAGTLSHIALDWTNGYGVHPFWPLDDRWYYGDAVFIVEPWLWIAALPPLVLLVRSAVARALLAVAFVAILGAAWTFGPVTKGTAALLTVGALAWAAVVCAAPATRRVALGIAAFLGFELVAFAASGAARDRVRAAAGAGYVDAALEPAAANPLCFGAMVMEVEGGIYRVTAADVAPFPGLRGVERCRQQGGGGGAGRPAPAGVRWGEEWVAPVDELRALFAGHCEVAAALRFVRVPSWEPLPGDSLRLDDLRYARGGGGFASFATPARATVCPRHVPPWVPPRADILVRG
ncbi:metal-dependent hydrolase [Roseisolibacter sp. H3M3-2]|uniref:metal-dependent hydrolase n=1 Tax=Roseisolibacter sp. H3M3-2 TaxID=3031323 RepID=UPI0023DAC2FD|nr:metal-dependent hydrolase [Roseisolibacter sp. H3M3-2]MDF1504778.1 metal-dependent hydrolase [Roseisolibacter sp. H3M3-2]